jgi:hypothetical protein
MSKLDELLSQEMTRRQFLITVGMAIMSLFGLSAILGLLTNKDAKAGINGYGSQTYGH